MQQQTRAGAALRDARQRSAFQTMLAIGANKRIPSREIIDRIGHKAFQRDIIKGLRPFFNLNPQLGYKVTGSGPYDPQTTSATAWIMLKEEIA
jgi:hypothetical protein